MEGFRIHGPPLAIGPPEARTFHKKEMNNFCVKFPNLQDFFVTAAILTLSNQFSNEFATN